MNKMGKEWKRHLKKMPLNRSKRPENDPKQSENDPRKRSKNVPKTIHRKFEND